MVPVCYWIILTIGIFPDIAIRIAFGTSLLVILPTAISGTWRHNKQKAVRWKTALILGLCGLLGAVLGATLAAQFPSNVLEIGFGGLVLAIALWMSLGLVPRLTREAEEPRVNFWLVVACGFPIGIVVGLTGLGGGVLIIPVLVLILNFSMHIAIGTSVASIILTSLGGIAGYIVNGLGVSGLLPYSIGYVNLPIWLCLAATSIPLAQLGARGNTCVTCETVKVYLYCLYGLLGLKDDWRILTGHKALSPRRHLKSAIWLHLLVYQSTLHMDFRSSNRAE